MLVRLLAGLGKFVLFLASCAFITGVSLFVVGAYLTTWPLMRMSARGQRQNALVQLGVSLFALARTFAPDADPESRPSPPKSAP